MLILKFTGGDIMKKTFNFKKIISIFLTFNLLFLNSYFVILSDALYDEQNTFVTLNNVLNNHDTVKESNAFVIDKLNFLIDQNYLNNPEDLKDLEKLSSEVKKNLDMQKKEILALCDAQKANLTYKKNILVGFENLGNSCFLNSALQVLLNASALNGKSFNEEFIKIIGSLQKDEKIKQILINDCPTVFALFILFKLVNYSLENLKVILKNYVVFLLEYFNKSGIIYDGINQADSTETLQIILDRALNELKSLYNGYYLSNNDYSKLQRLIAFLENMFTLNFVENNSAFKQTVYHSEEILEDKINNNVDLNLEEDIFNNNKIIGEMPQNLIIQLPRRHYKKIDTGKKDPKTNKPIFTIESVKLKNKIKIPEYLSTNDGNYRIREITLQTGNALSGHYFVYVRKGEDWFELNDSKVISLGSNISNILNSDLVLKNCVNVLYEKCK